MLCGYALAADIRCQTKTGLLECLVCGICDEVNAAKHHSICDDLVVQLKPRRPILGHTCDLTLHICCQKLVCL